MRRLLGVVALLVLGLMVGFMVRLVWPRRSDPVYVAPSASAGRRT